MPKSHPPYPAEFKRRLVELVRTGRNPASIRDPRDATHRCEIPVRDSR